LRQQGESNNITIQFNESHHNKTVALYDGGGFDFDGGMTNSVLQYNYSHHNHGPAFLMVGGFWAEIDQRNNTIRYNISEDDSRSKTACIQIANENHTNCHVYGNTVYLSTIGLVGGAFPAAVECAWTDPTTQVFFRNNILCRRRWSGARFNGCR
jgi:hypothetical protein